MEVSLGGCADGGAQRRYGVWLIGECGGTHQCYDAERRIKGLSAALCAKSSLKDRLAGYLSQSSAKTGELPMTTTVTIAAHLSTEKEVRVKIINNGSPVEEFALQDGEKAERYVYDGREISVQEVVK